MSNFDIEKVSSVDAELTEQYGNLALIYHSYLMLEAPHQLSKKVFDYLTGRGLDANDLIPMYGVGYCPSPYNSMYERVTFPYLDVNGNCVTIVGRVLPGEEGNIDDGRPRYWHYAFHKNQHLWNLFHLIDHDPKITWCIVTEGIFDVLGLQAAGIYNAVATLGATFSPIQATLLHRYFDNFLFAFDNDGAGNRATMKALSLCRQLGYKSFGIAWPPQWKDAGEAGATNPSDLHDLVRDSILGGEDLEERYQGTRLLNIVKALHRAGGHA